MHSTPLCRWEYGSVAYGKNIFETDRMEVEKYIDKRPNLVRHIFLFYK